MGGGKEPGEQAADERLHAVARREPEQPGRLHGREQTGARHTPGAGDEQTETFAQIGGGHGAVRGLAGHSLARGRGVATLSAHMIRGGGPAGPGRPAPAFSRLHPAVSRQGFGP